MKEREREGGRERQREREREGGRGGEEERRWWGREKDRFKLLLASPSVLAT